MVYESNWIIGGLEAAIISRSEVVCAMLQSGGLNVCWLHKEQEKSEEPKQNEMLPVAAAPIWECVLMYLCMYVSELCMYRTYICIYLCTYVFISGYIHVCCMHAYMNVCVCVWICVYIIMTCLYDSADKQHQAIWSVFCCCLHYRMQYGSYQISAHATKGGGQWRFGATYY